MGRGAVEACGGWDSWGYAVGMKRFFYFGLMGAVSMAAGTWAGATAEEVFVPMFNGKDLSGWLNVSCAPETWSVVADGVIHCTGKPIGALRTERQYENFILEAEWRHLSAGGNSGVFIWGSPISSPGQPFLRGIEVQVLDHGYNAKGKNEWYSTHGDVFPIHGATMVPHGRHNGMRSFPAEERSKPSPEWNHYRITCQDGKLTLAVNGKVVSGGDECFWRKGYLALESEGAPVEFRNVRICEKPSTGATEAQSAPLDAGWQHLYNGVDLRGWKLDGLREGAWQVADWRLILKGNEGKGGVPLWSEAVLGDGEWIADVNLPKEADLTKAWAGLCVRGMEKPLIVFGAGEAPFVLGPDQVKAGGWYRCRVRLAGQRVVLTVSEPQDANERVFEAVVEMPGSGAVGAADLGWGVGFANFHVREETKSE
jgi:hypothetical protein